VRKEESTRGGVIKLTAIVALDDLDGEAELSGYPSENMKNRGECIRCNTPVLSNAFLHGNHIA
jgi:hypothetical protein